MKQFKNQLNMVMAYWISVMHPCASRPWKRQDLKIWEAQDLAEEHQDGAVLP